MWVGFFDDLKRPPDGIDSLRQGEIRVAFPRRRSTQHETALIKKAFANIHSDRLALIAIERIANDRSAHPRSRCCRISRRWLPGRRLVDVPPRAYESRLRPC